MSTAGGDLNLCRNNEEILQYFGMRTFLLWLCLLLLLVDADGFRLKPKELKPEYKGPWNTRQSQTSTQVNSELDKFRNIMCYAYTGAGLSHAIDLAGDSKLLELAGAPHFQDLPLEGQILAAFWCLTGPLCFFARPQQNVNRAITDATIAFYGLYEIAMSVISFNSFDTSPTAIINAALVQTVVGYCFLTIKKKNETKNGSTVI